MARSMLSFGTLAALALSQARRSRGLVSGSPPPSRAATVISRTRRVKTLPRLACPAMGRKIPRLNRPKSLSRRRRAARFRFESSSGARIALYSRSKPGATTMTNRIRRLLAPAALLGGLFPALALGQAGELNLLTDLGTPFPPGCLSIDLPEQPSDPDSLLVDNDIAVPSALSDFNDASVNVRVWRVACADEGYSVVLVRLEQIAGNPVVIPQVYAEAGDVDRPFHEAQLLTIPAAGNVGATGGIVTNSGTTFMLAVEPVSIDGQTTFLPEDYNEQFTVEFTWEAFSGAETVNFPVLLDRFEPSLDPPQFEDTVLNGR